MLEILTQIFDISNKISAYNLRDLNLNFGNFHQTSINFEQNVQNFDDQTARDFDQNVGDL